MLTREQIIRERNADPRKRDKHLRDMREASENLVHAIRRHREEPEMRHTCEVDPDRCYPCSLGQHAEMADEGIGMEGVDF